MPMFLFRIATHWTIRVLLAALAAWASPGLALIAAMSIVGLPLAFLLMFVPAAASLYIASELAFQLLIRRRMPTAHGYACAVGAVLVGAVAVALLANADVDGLAGKLVSKDVDAPQAGSIRRLAVVGVEPIYGRRTETSACDGLCLRLLLNGAVEEVLIPDDDAARRNREALTPSDAATAFRFAKESSCAARRIENGEAPAEAAARGADALGLAVIAITFTIVAVFLPVSFIGGVVGKYFTEFGLTTTFAVLSSLCVARLVTPLMCARWLRPHSGGEPAPGRLQQGYHRLLAWVMRHPRSTLGLGGMLLLATLGLMASLPSSFMPETRPRAIPVNYELAPGASLRQSVQAAEALRAALAGVPDISEVFAYERGSPERGALRLQLRPPSERKLSREALERSLRERLATVPDVRSSLLLGDWEKDLSLSFVSSDPRQLEAAMQRLRQEAAALPQLQDLSLEQGPPLASLDLRLRPEAAARLGVDASSIADALRLATLGASETALPRIVVDGQLIAVRLRLAGGPAQGLDALRQLPVPVAGGGRVPLETVATLEPGSTPSSLTRLNRERLIQLQANLARGVTISEAMSALEALPAWRELPAAVRLAPYGQTEQMAEMFERFGLAALFGLVAVYALLVLLFDDWLQPLSIMLALPLALSGAALALLLGGYSLNLSTVIGLLMLFGIVAKNSILLVDFIIEARRGGLSLDRAISQAGHERVRPIVMTTLAMVGGMLPAALGWGHDDGFRAPMAVAVIGGLISSTLLSLLFVPLVYRQLDLLRQRLRGRPTQTC